MVIFTFLSFLHGHSLVYLLFAPFDLFEYWKGQTVHGVNNDIAIYSFSDMFAINVQRNQI